MGVVRNNDNSGSEPDLGNSIVDWLRWPLFGIMVFDMCLMAARGLHYISFLMGLFACALIWYCWDTND